MITSRLGAVFFEVLVCDTGPEVRAAIGLDEAGNPEVLGFWTTPSWSTILDELLHRGVVGIEVACVPEPGDVQAVFHAAFPGVVVMANVASTVSAAMASVAQEGGHDDVGPVSSAFARIFLTSRTADAARSGLEHFAQTSLGQRNPGCLRTIEAAWPSLLPYFELGRSMRATLYSHGVEALTRQLQYVLSARDFRDPAEAVNTLWLAVSSATSTEPELPAQRRCSRPGCGNVFARNKRGRPREFCSEGCRRMHWELEQRWNEQLPAARYRNDPVKLAEQLTTTAKLLMETAHHLAGQMRA